MDPHFLANIQEQDKRRGATGYAAINVNISLYMNILISSSDPCYMRYIHTISVAHIENIDPI